MINVRVPQKSSFNCSKIRQSTEKRPSCRHPEIQLKYCSCAYPVDQQGFSTVLLFFLYHKKKNDAVEKPCWSKYSNLWWECNYLAFDSITYIDITFIPRILKERTWFIARPPFLQMPGISIWKYILLTNLDIKAWQFHFRNMLNQVLKWSKCCARNCGF